MKLLPDDISEHVRGGSLFSLTIPITLNGIVSPQTNAAALTAVAPISGSAATILEQANALDAFQSALVFSR